MASDLVAYHYRHSAPSHILHAALKAFPETPDTSEPATLFTLFDSENEQSPAHTRRSWLLINSANLLTRAKSQMEEVMGETYCRNLTINSYDKNIVAWATDSVNSERNITVDMLYEMKLDIPLCDPTPRPFQELDTDALEELQDTLVALQDGGFDIEEDPDWFCSFKPEEKSIVLLGGERVFTVVEKASGEKAAYVTLLLDPETSDRLYVSSLETFPRWRRRGLAKALMRHVHVLHANGWLRTQEETSCADEGRKPREIWLTVFCENVGPVGMYHRLGYRVNRCLWVVNCDSR
ncbi:hypothetical protein Q9L58_008266 [Maublancomyces gigas]|uniref:N-acetyltransferase domain-containing protein n=1 Tax=Discina gigas TaxID=1032678 RepID=A0ABR3GAE7_9PEZI